MVFPSHDSIELLKEVMLPSSLTEKELVIINQAKMVFKEKLEINCTDCDYCLPCPAGVIFLKNFAKYEYHHLFGSPETKEHYQFPMKLLLLR